MVTTNDEIQATAEAVVAHVRVTDNKGGGDTTDEEYEEEEVLTEDDDEELFDEEEVVEEEEEEEVVEEEEVAEDEDDKVVASRDEAGNNIHKGVAVERNKEEEKEDDVPTPVAPFTPERQLLPTVADKVSSGTIESEADTLSDKPVNATTRPESPQVPVTSHSKEVAHTTHIAAEKDADDQPKTMSQVPTIDILDTEAHRGQVDTIGQEEQVSGGGKLTDTPPSVVSEGQARSVDADGDKNSTTPSSGEKGPDETSTGEPNLDDTARKSKAKTTTDISRHFADPQSPKEVYGWEKPAWTSKALRSTGKGATVRQGGDLQAPITHVDKSEHMDYINFEANPRVVLKSTDQGKNVRKGTDLARPITHIRRTIKNNDEDEEKGNS